MHTPDLTSVSLLVKEKDHALRVDLHNHRTTLIAQTICAIFDELRPWHGHLHKELISFVEDRPGHDFRYASNPERIKQELHWQALGNFEEALRQTILSVEVT